jgi:hypothetical protein
MYDDLLACLYYYYVLRYRIWSLRFEICGSSLLIDGDSSQRMVGSEIQNMDSVGCESGGVFAESELSMNRGGLRTGCSGFHLSGPWPLTPWLFTLWLLRFRVLVL